MDITKKELDMLIHNLPGDIVIYQISPGCAIPVYFSERMYSYTGITNEELMAQMKVNAVEKIFPGDRELVIRKVKEIMQNHTSMEYTYRILHRTKGVIWVHVRAHSLGMLDGKPLLLMEFYNISSDVDGYAEVINHSGNLIYVIDEATHELFYANTKAQEAAGSHDYAGKKCYEFARQNQSPCPWCIMPKMTGATASEKGIVDPVLGIVMDVDARRIKWFDRDAIFIHVHDVTAQTERIRQAKAMYQRTIHELLLTNPQAICAFRLNLTKDLCDEGHGMSTYIQNLVSADTATQAIANIISLIPDKKTAQEFGQALNRQALLDTFAKGEHHLMRSYQRCNEQGDVLWVNTYINIIQNPDTNDVEAICYSVDVTRNKEEEQVVTAITKKDYDYIAIIDVNTQELRVLNVRSYTSPVRPVQMPTYDESLRKTFQKYRIISSDNGQFMDVLSFVNVQANLAKHENFLYSFLMEDAEGRQYRKQMSYRYLDESQQKILFLRTDVTQSFRAEQRQTQKIQEALLAAERANEMKTNFLSNVSHDIRTPLNAILGYACLAKQTEEVEKKNKFLDKIGIAGDTLLTLINDTLDLQKIENGVITLKPEQIRMDVLVEQVVDSVRSLLDAKHIEFVFDDSQTTHKDIIADVLRLKQILINLISNAIKFTPYGGKIELIATCLEVKNNVIYDKFIVRDTGIGMTPGFLPKMFEPFAQERTVETAHIGGSGLGLSIVKRIITLMGGTIEVKSELGKGTEFIFYLHFPKPKDTLHLPETQQLGFGTIQGLHFLLCEDNEMNTEIAKLMLENAGVRVTCASNGQEGKEKFCSSEPGTFDGILMDIRMPVMNGYEATQAIRKSRHKQAKSIPIIALSADAYESDVKKSLSVGMNAHIGKPINPMKMYEVIADMCAPK